MIKTILFDLDDTLLGNHVEQFLPHYFSLITQYAKSIIDPQKFMGLLMAGTQAMIDDKDPTVTNREAFWDYFHAQTGLDSNITEAFFLRFYQEQFPAIQQSVTAKPIAPTLMQTCVDHNLQIVIATNPIFPQIAQEQRLAWAGVPVDQFPYALVTDYQNMHAIKPDPAYYNEILEKVGANPASTIMVGDDWKNDIIPANQVGLKTYWISESTPEDTAIPLLGYGTLARFHDYLLTSLV